MEMWFMGFVDRIVSAIILLSTWEWFIKPWWQSRTRRENRIWCICEVGDRIGLTLREDYDEAARLYWKWIIGRHIQDPSTVGHRMEIAGDKVIVIRKEDLSRVAKDLHLEKREFLVPELLASGRTASQAFRLIHGKPLDPFVREAFQ